MRIAFGRTRRGIRSLFHLCAEPDLFLEEWDRESDTEFVHLCAKRDFFFGRNRPGIRTPVHLCAEPDLVLDEPDLKSEPQFIHVWNQKPKHLKKGRGKSGPRAN
jgi:hypothetical protein